VVWSKIRRQTEASEASCSLTFLTTLRSRVAEISRPCFYVIALNSS
jgi:hypothetical protein